MQIAGQAQVASGDLAEAITMFEGIVKLRRQLVVSQFA